MEHGTITQDNHAALWHGRFEEELSETTAVLLSTVLTALSRTNSTRRIQQELLCTPTLSVSVRSSSVSCFVQPARRSSESSAEKRRNRFFMFRSFQPGSSSPASERGSISSETVNSLYPWRCHTARSHAPEAAWPARRHSAQSARRGDRPPARCPAIS